MINAASNDSSHAATILPKQKVLKLTILKGFEMILTRILVSVLLLSVFNISYGHVLTGTWEDPESGNVIEVNDEGYFTTTITTGRVIEYLTGETHEGKALSFEREIYFHHGYFQSEGFFTVVRGIDPFQFTCEHIADFYAWPDPDRGALRVEIHMPLYVWGRYSPSGGECSPFDSARHEPLRKTGTFFKID